MWLPPPTTCGVVATHNKICVCQPHTWGISKKFKQPPPLAKTLSADNSDEGAGRRGRQATVAPPQARAIIDLAATTISTSTD